MQFSPSQDQQMVLDALRAVASGQLRPAAAHIDAAGQWSAALDQHLRELGAYGLLASEAAGGLGLDAVAAVQCFEVLGAAEAGTAQALVEHGVALLALQTALNQRGFDSGTPDGVMGPQTRGAIRSYQRSAGLPADGYPTLALLQRLLAQ